MTQRRDPFEPSSVATAQPVPTSIYDSIRVAAPYKRNRKWEREHQKDKAVYRGVDPKASLKVKTIAADLFVPTGEVARAMIEFSLRSYEAGELALFPRPDPNRMRMTLFPTSDSFHWVASAKRSAKRKPTVILWRVITTWRSFPHDLKKELAELASDDGLNVPIGELVTVLLRFGLKAYEDGRLTLEAVQKAGAFTLFLDGKK